MRSQQLRRKKKRCPRGILDRARTHAHGNIFPCHRTKSHGCVPRGVPLKPTMFYPPSFPIQKKPYTVASCEKNGCFEREQWEKSEQYLSEPTDCHVRCNGIRSMRNQWKMLQLTTTSSFLKTFKKVLSGPEHFSVDCDMLSTRYYVPGIRCWLFVASDTFLVLIAKSSDEHMQDTKITKSLQVQILICWS